MTDSFKLPSWSKMSEDRPLDSLFPELAGEYQDVPASAEAPAAPLLCPQVLEVELEHTWQWAMATFEAPQLLRELLSPLNTLVEATLLQELSRPPGYGGLEGRAFEGAVLFAFEALPDAWASPLEAAGWHRLNHYSADDYRERMGAWQRIAREEGFACPAQPAQIWWMPLHRPEPTIAAKLKFVQVRTAEALGARVWGQNPGMPSKVMAQQLQQQFSLSPAPTLDGLHELDMLLVERAPHRVRWLDPMIFQGLCDLICVIAIHELRHRVQWGVSQTDGHGGVYPPLMRLERASGAQDIELGQQLYRAIIAPLEDEQEAPLLRDWLKALLR